MIVSPRIEDKLAEDQHDLGLTPDELVDVFRDGGRKLGSDIVLRDRSGMVLRGAPRLIRRIRLDDGRVIRVEHQVARGPDGSPCVTIVNVYPEAEQR